MAATGYTSGAHGDEGTPKKNKMVEGKFAPKLSLKARYKLADGKQFEKDSLIVDHFWTPPVSGDTKPNYNIVGNNSCRMVFKIPVGNMSEDETKDRLREMVKKSKRTPDLDCGIYLVDEDKDYFLPINNNTKMPEKPDYQKIYNAIYPAGSSKSHYSRIVLNSHFWTDLTQIKYLIEYELERLKCETEFKDNNTIYVSEPITSEYIIIGLNNSIKNGYKLKQDKNIKLNPKHTLVQFVIFKSIENMIEYVQSERFNLKGFGNIINNTINVGFNLTNGLKMEREHVYKRIDAERKYQDIAWGNDGHPKSDVPDEEKPVAEWLNYIEFHLNKAKDYNYRKNQDHSLEELRKVAALAVRAMEIHGCPERRMPTRIGNIIINPDGTTCKCDDCDSKK